ncbi:MULTISPECIES: YesL family protein [Bacillus]|uniref:YesL family protein n=1 Tax=Bacillus TaxID=1386 RepID=UPI0003FEB80E|nr:MULTISPECIES: YesL family protein [Bacillus]QHZ46460.1 YesL family protein [Bacillus sp. NSP9.1]WFA06597.1 YesL family protein [Bacillus sp. HSf4]
MIHTLTNGFNRFCEWVMRLAYLNLLWIGFSLAGAVIFGLAPATAAMFSVTRQWVKGETDIPVFQTFFQAFKKEWAGSSILGFILAAIALVLYVDFQIVSIYFQGQPAVLSLFISLFIIYAIIFLYTFPIYVHYQMKRIDVLKYSFMIGFSRPLITLLMILSAFGMVLAALFHVTFLLFFSGSGLSLLLTKLASSAFFAIDGRGNDKQTAVPRVK